MIDMRLVRKLTAAGVKWKETEPYRGVKRLLAYDIGTNVWINVSGWTETKLVRWIRASRYVHDARNLLDSET